MATLAEIAKACGTSTATVSYVLSDQGDRRRISPAMQEQIRETAKALGYQRKAEKPQEKAPRIGFFWPERNLETSISNVITGVNQALYLENAPVELSMIPFSYNSLVTQSALWAKKAYDACVIFSPNTADMEVLSQRHTKVPTVLMNRKLSGYSCVSTDYALVGRLAAEQAIAKGGEDFILVHNTIPHMGMAQRSREVHEVCRSYGIDAGLKTIYCSNSIDEAYELGLRLLLQSALPRVILCMYDTVAFGLIRALNESGVRVGEQVEVLATGTSYPGFFSRATPSITVVDLKLAEVAQRAVRLAIDHATGRIAQPTELIVPPEILYRESSPRPTPEQIQALVLRKRQALSQSRG